MFHIVKERGLFAVDVTNFKATINKSQLKKTIKLNVRKCIDLPRRHAKIHPSTALVPITVEIVKWQSTVLRM